jgi:transposase-like protein
MELSGGPGRVTGSVADYRRNLVDRIVHRTVSDLAQEKGIAPDSRRRWSRLVARAEKTASTFEKTLPPAREAREIEIEGLRLFDRQAVRVRILGREEEPSVEGPKSRA